MPTPPEQKKTSVARPPIVVVMGHIDHGKSTLLDYIRKTNIVAGEAGGITQHVGAYQAEHVSKDGKKHLITFLDTPGHEAFCSIRERGAQAADIAILVVSAEDGVKPQTLEAFKEITKAKIPYIVAINKMDKPNADENKTKESLGENQIYVEGWGGDVPFVAISSLNGKGVPELLDMIMLVSELADLKADPAALAEGLIVETEMDTRKGISATLLITNGTLSTGAFVIAGGSFAPVRYIEDFMGKKIEAASPSMPAIVVGWSEIPSCGTMFKTVGTKKEAEKLAEEFKAADKQSKADQSKADARKQKLQAIEDARNAVPGSSAKKEETETAVIPLIIKADVIGSLDGVKHELAKITHDRVKLKIVSEGLGSINENDVKVATGDANIIVLGFNVKPDAKAEPMIQRSSVPLNIKTFTIIYELTDFVRATLLAKVPKEYAEELLGRAKILALFSKEKDRQVIGGKVQEGTLEVGASVRIMRREANIGEGTIRELQQQKKRVKEVATGYEFGTMIESKMEIAVGDKIEAVKMVEKK